MGIRAPSAVGPEAFEKPFDHWTWQLVSLGTETEAGDASGLTRLEVIIRHDSPVLVHRVTQLLRLVPRRSPTAAVHDSP